MIKVFESQLKLINYQLTELLRINFKSVGEGREKKRKVSGSVLRREEKGGQRERMGSKVLPAKAAAAVRLGLRSFTHSDHSLAGSSL
jgi:hypothetical protein